MKICQLFMTKTNNVVFRFAPKKRTVENLQKVHFPEKTPNFIGIKNQKWFGFVLSILTIVNPSFADETQYVYDRLGRLIEVVATDGTKVIYQYDATGNILAIRKNNTNSLIIAEVTPYKGESGIPVDIYGSGFDPILSNNKVTFNGTAATVTAATNSHLSTTVPPNSSTGKIVISNANGTATSANDFVTNSIQSPQILSFSPTSGAYGAAVNITGTNFSTVSSANRVGFNGIISYSTAVSTTSISTIVPSAMSSGKLSVATKDGIAYSKTDFYVLPPSVKTADIGYFGRLLIDGPSQTVTIATAGKKALILFDGTRSQILSLLATSKTFKNEVLATVFSPSGAIINPGNDSTNYTTIDLSALDEVGTYTILITPTTTDKGKIALQLKAEAQGNVLIDGPPIQISLDSGRNGRYKFNGSAGQGLALFYNALSTIPLTTITTFSIYTPSGKQLVSTGDTSDGSFPVPVLPESGSYALTVDPYVNASMQVSLGLVSDVMGTINVDGSPVDITTPKSAQNARFTFKGTAGQNLGVGYSNLMRSTDSDPIVFSIFSPDGNLFSMSVFQSDGGETLPTLPSDGLYTLVADPSGSAGATVRLTISSDVIGNLVSGAAPITFTSVRPGQNGRYSFSGIAGKAYTLTFKNGTFPTATLVKILKPNGTTLKTISVTSSATIAISALAVSGTYQITVDPDGANVGKLDIQIK